MKKKEMKKYLKNSKKLKIFFKSNKKFKKKN